jgi:hypothetical protein
VSIKPLEQLSIRARIGLFFAIVIIVVVLIYIIGSFTQAEGEESEKLYQGIPLDAHFLPLDKEALDLAYKDHLRVLFKVWLTDDIKVVHRINNGLRIARRAYAHAAEQIEIRERALQRR